MRINIRERGKLVGKREVHNTWVDRGREYLAGMIGYSSYSPDTPERSDRVRWFGAGIGGHQQTSTIPSVVDTAYPAGSDPLSTSGKEYREDFPFVYQAPNHNPITTLERPVRITGGSNPYGSAAPTDRWMVTETSNRLIMTHLTLTELTVHAIIDATVNEVVYAPFVLVPLSEAGLFTDEPGNAAAGVPFATIMTYVTFDTISLTNDIDVEFIWSVKF